MKKILKDEILQSDVIAIKDDKGQSVTYRELMKKANNLTQYMEERAFVFILCDNQLETIEFLYEIININRVPLLLASDIDKELFDNLVRTYQPQFIYCKKTQQYVEDNNQQIEFEDHVLLRTKYNKTQIHPDVALLLSTSGTTGSAKLVKISYSNLYNAGKYGGLQMNIQRGQKGLCPTPLNHILGIIFCVWHWGHEATILTSEEMVISNKFSEFYKKEKVNNFAATPYIYQMLERIKFWDDEKVSYLHWALAAGEAMPEDYLKTLVYTLEEKFWIAYGQTECSGFISAIQFTKDLKRLDSVGKPLKNIETIVDKETNELLVKSGTVCMGYANNITQLCEEDINQGLLYTGDIVNIDNEGYIYLKGRLARFVKILGKRISLSEVEEILRKEFLGVDFACVGKDNHISVFYSSSSLKIDKKDIQYMLENKLKIPHKFIICLQLEKMPRNNVGKIQYVELEELNN